MKPDNSKNILITGVSSGIGEGLAREYLRQGATVWGLSRRCPAPGRGANKNRGGYPHARGRGHYVNVYRTISRIRVLHFSMASSRHGACFLQLKNDEREL